MDERKITIRHIEEKKQTDSTALKHLSTALGQTLLQRVVDSEAFPDEVRKLLAEYRALQKESSDVSTSIKCHEADMLKLKTIDETISVKEKESARLGRDFSESCQKLGREIVASQDFEEFAAPYRRQAETLRSKIEEQEQRIQLLDANKGGIFAQIGANAQKAIAKAVIIKTESSLDKLYRNCGEQYFSANPGVPSDEATDAALQDSQSLKNDRALVSEELADLHEERRKIGATFGGKVSPVRHLESLQKCASCVEKELAALYLRFGFVVTAADTRETFTTFLNDEDTATIKSIAEYQSLIDAAELKIKKLNAAITIDSEKDDIKRKKKAITQYEEKITAAEEEIAHLKRQIENSEQNIEELNAFLAANNSGLVRQL